MGQNSASRNGRRTSPGQQQESERKKRVQQERREALIQEAESRGMSVDDLLRLKAEEARQFGGSNKKVFISATPAQAAVTRIVETKYF
jgi:hypothetical protein